ncbi:hypothetical protein Brsp01_46070 [Brucella sp. NBRC 12950]|nr:hypothetical protein Brsp01_46070 [Brucella sp. NBRC 12950]
MVYHKAADARYCGKALGANVDNGENDGYVKDKKFSRKNKIQNTGHRKSHSRLMHDGSKIVYKQKVTRQQSR